MYDKVLHVALGFGIAAPLAWAGYPVSGVMLAGLAGVAKEAWDRLGNGTPELADLIATLIGGIAGAMVLA